MGKQQKGVNGLLFYDFEVFKYDWLVVVMDMTAKKTHVIINSPEELEALYKANIKEIWVGFNSRHYDQYILKAILCGFDPKKVNDYIITKGNPGWKFSSLFRQFPLWNYDVMLNTDVGLKSFEGFMGNDIKETSVPFNIDRKLTPEEIAETVKYCKHDVEQTVQVFLKRTEEFNTMMYFIKHFGLSMDYISKTKAQLAAEILGGNRKGADFDDEFQFPILDCLHLNKYKHIAEWYANPENHDYSKKQDKQIVAGVEHTFAWGGGHGARAKYSADGVFLIIDVTAYYPSLQKKYHFGYRVMNHPENFEFIHDSNIAYKRKGDKKARQPFKIMDNAISGQMKQKSSALYDPMSNNSICINGQLLLLDLVEHIEPYCELIQNNTDGIIVKLKDYEHDFDVLDDVVYEWEQRTGMKMDFDTYIGTIYQKDVNNYLLIDRKTGAVKAKGGYVMKLNDLSYDLPIINKALVDYMIHGIPVRRTIMECQDLREFQLVSRISSKYTHILYGDKPIKEKCIRVFASNNPADPGVKKVHAVRKTTAKLTNSPEHCFIFNDDVKGIPVPDKLDRQWYIDFANKRLSDFGVV
ncbi:MAG: DNA polymerase family B [Bacteriophage sp.]|nr:MAG: DNA polymerase family B [Bacteriophage sp.]